ncbi:hypothetical protein BV25DRAFT_888186 [Artomyces pyxidatus]|uniref:Uncharacterized protein n=1 Tax=Artomyces pyxidatus TaxID=48021 RepID=A0ACB8THP8_9AGAM|nr:hypothetical protein BV25DRAFT_888186 [Artomyces pyxidatus]
MTITPAPAHPGIEFIFLGTGTSSSLPNVSCLTAGPEEKPCRTCLATLTPDGKKNVRRNTSAVMRIDGKDGRKRTIVIDVGKNFQAAAVEWFPKYDLRRIDAVFITHAHADAMNGLDDLRGWTLRGAIQKNIDVYVSQATFVEVERSFPYMVNKEFRSGGGDVPEFIWHIFEDKVPVEIEGSGIIFTPFKVHHGRTWAAAPPPGFAHSTPMQSGATTPSTPFLSFIPPNGLLTPSSPAMKLTQLTPLSSKSSPSPPSSRRSSEDSEPKVNPYICYGFEIQDSIVYLSDVSLIPDDSWELLERPALDGGRRKPYAVAIVDCLRPIAHISHYGIKEAVNCSRRLNAQRSYLIGFGHEISHEEYTTIGEVVGGKDVSEFGKLSAGEEKCIERLDEGHPIWLRPSHDGLRFTISPEGVVEDNSYGPA